jgi:acyl-CoA reductase-like NAD-dependent aldehyde dehydrogenase
MTSHIRCVSPVDGRVYADRLTVGPSEIEGVLKQARAAQKAWREVPLAQRGALVLKGVEALKAMGEDIAREPVEIVFTITPWNYPYLTTVNSLVPALIARNALLLKQAAQTLLVGDRYQKAFDSVGLPKGLLTHIVLDHCQTEPIIAGGHVNHVAFTGSVEAGRAMERAAAGTFTTLGLELGGKDPAYVAPDANLSFAVENLVDGAFFNSGPCCGGVGYAALKRPKSYHLRLSTAC